MKKIVSALALLSSFAVAQTSEVTITTKDVFPQLTNLLGLEVTASNASTAPKKVRINYELPTVEDGAKYGVDNVIAEYTIQEFSTSCKIDHDKVEDLVFNIRKSGLGNYFLDAQFTLKPKEDKILCFPIYRNDLAAFESTSHTKTRLSFSVDKSGSPLNNPVIYNYIPKARYSYNGLNIIPNVGAPYNLRIKANVMSNGVNPAPDSKQLMAWDAGHWVEIEARNLIDLGIEAYGMYKDTRMLVASVGPLVKHFHWNESTFDGHMFNGVEERNIFMGRCWLIAVFNTYCHFYGNRNTKPDAMTQDEMLYHAKTERSSNDRQFSIFQANDREGDYLSTSAYVINKIMFDANAKVYYTSKQPITGKILFNALANGTPITFDMGSVKNHEDMTAEKGSGPGHVMLIDALALDSKGDTLVHIINMDNFGNERYVYLNLLKQHMTGYILMQKPTGIMKTDAEYPVDQDYDNDGIIDFDEKYRFLSDPNKADSDGDGISDMNEIYSYVSRINISAGNIHAPTGETQITVRIPFAFDYKDNTTFPQWNMDFDGDSIPDGEEDLNKNGIYEPDLGETDPLDKRVEISETEIPKDVVFYALDKLDIGKDIYCETRIDNHTRGVPDTRVSDEDKKDYVSDCNVTAAAENTDENVVSIGSNTSISIVNSKGNVQIQKDGRAFLINLYNKEAWLDDKNGHSKIYTLHRPVQTWPFRIKTSLPTYEAGSKSVVVKSGDSLTVKNGDKYSRIEVKKGGLLIIGEGEMYIDTLQLDAGSTFDILNDGYSTYLHVNGPVTWKASNNKKTDDWIIPDCPATQKYCPGIQYLALAAFSFKLYQHSSENTVIDTRWVGTIIAPKSNLTLGLTDNANVMAGQFLAKNIKVRDGMDVYQTVYEPEEKPVVTPEEKDSTSTDMKDSTDTKDSTNVKDSTDAKDSTNVKDSTDAKDSTNMKDSTDKKDNKKDSSDKKDDKKDFAISNNNLVVRGNLNIINMNRNELMFRTASTNRYQVFIAKANGTKAAEYTFDRGNVGLNFVSIANAKLTRGKYYVTIKQNGHTSSKMLVIK
jgi:hypothetical protein